MQWRNRDLGSWCLGTAQLGFDYGISNSHGRPSLEQAEQIIQIASDAGVRLFDTAAAYGDSQEVLGKCFQRLSLPNDPLIITKLSDEDLLSNHCRQTVSEALKKVNTRRFFGLLAHSQAALQNAEQHQKAFALLKSEGLVEFCGVSVYSAGDAKRALELEHFDLVQMPLNVLDRSAMDLNLLELAHKADKMIFFRSALLQGLLTLNALTLPPEMKFAVPTLSAWHDVCVRENLPANQLALQIAHYLAGGFPLVIGAELPEQVRENISFLQQRSSDISRLAAETERLAREAPPALRNPSLWPAKATSAK